MRYYFLYLLFITPIENRYRKYLKKFKNKFGITKKMIVTLW